MDATRLLDEVERVADANTAGLIDLRVDAEVDLALARVAAVILDQLQRVEVTLAGVRVARGHGAAFDRTADPQHSVAYAYEAGIPLVLLVRAAAIDREQHAKASGVDLLPGFLS